MNAEDFMGTPDARLVAALDTPFAWPQSGLAPLPWFPFTVAASRGRGRGRRAAWRGAPSARTGTCASCCGFTPRFRLLVLVARRLAEVSPRSPTYGIPHFTADGNLVVGSEPADAWHDVSRELAQLPARRPRCAALRDVHGARSAFTATRPTCASSPRR